MYFYGHSTQPCQPKDLLYLNEWVFTGWRFNIISFIMVFLGFLHNSSLSSQYTAQQAVPEPTWKPMVHSVVSNAQSLDHCAALCHTSAVNCDVFCLSGTTCYLGDSTFTNGTETVPSGNSDIYLIVGKFFCKVLCRTDFSLQ